MADMNIEFPVDVRRNNNQKSKNYGQLYAVSYVKNTLSTRGLAQHIADHGSLCTLEVVQLVLGQLSKCVPELLSQGVGIQLDGLGTFYPTLEASRGYDSLQELVSAGADQAVRGVHIRFRPVGDNILNLTSRNFKARCTLRLRDYVEVDKASGGDGSREVRVKQRMPIGDYLLNGGFLTSGGSDGTGSSGSGSDGSEPDVRP